MTDDTEVVIWPSFWRAYWKYLIPLQVVYWVSVLIGVVATLLIRGVLIVSAAWQVLTGLQVALLLFSAVLGAIAVQCSRVYLTADGVRPSNGRQLRGRMVYPWADIVGVELVERWYGRWLTVTTARKRFFYLPAHVSDPERFVEAVDWFVSPDHPLAIGLRRYVCGWSRRPHFG